MEQARSMARIVCNALEEKKGEAVTVLDIREVSIMADYFSLPTEVMTVRCVHWLKM